MFHQSIGNLLEIGYVLVPGERRKGYCTEAVKIVLDYLFLFKYIVRVQAHTDARNVASQKVLQNLGFKKRRASPQVHFRQRRMERQMSI